MVDLPITKWIKKKIRRLIGIVEDTDVATHSIASGKYVIWKGDLYKSKAAIAVGGSLSLSNLSPVSDGGLNELSEQIGTLNSNIATINSKLNKVLSLGSHNSLTAFNNAIISQIGSMAFNDSQPIKIVHNFAGDSTWHFSIYSGKIDKVNTNGTSVITLSDGIDFIVGAYENNNLTWKKIG